MACKPCSSGIVSLLAVITTFACVSVGAEGRLCSLESRGYLKTFQQDFTELPLPCKYRLADFTCGDYRVKVTPGSALDMDYTFSPVTVWVKVVNTVTNQTVKLRTSQEILTAAFGGTTDNVWRVKEGNTDFLDFAGYRDYSIRLEKSGVFAVIFMMNTVNVQCNAPNFASPGVPETLCGDGSTPSEFGAARAAMFGDQLSTVAEFLLYVTLDDTTITQSKNCADLASQFQGCGNKTAAVSKCHQIFSDRNVVRCLVGLGTRPEEVFDYCLRKTCDGDESNRPDLGDCTVVD